MGASGSWYCMAVFGLIEPAIYYYRLGPVGSLDDINNFLSQIITSSYDGFVGYSGLWWNFFGRQDVHEKIAGLDILAWQAAH